MTCVSKVSYTVLINGKHSQRFLPARGLRQGDLLSYFLFALCLEYLSIFLYSLKQTRGLGFILDIRGAKLLIWHLQMIFCFFAMLIRVLLVVYGLNFRNFQGLQVCKKILTRVRFIFQVWNKIRWIGSFKGWAFLRVCCLSIT